MALRDIIFKDSKFGISYNVINNNAKKNMVILHGWGSNKELMKGAFKDSFKDFNHLYIDLPGFGASPNEVFLNTSDYAQIIDIMLDEIVINGVSDYKVVMGHSFGGKIALHLNREIILLSSAGILPKKPLKIKIKIFLAKILKFAGLKLSFLKADDAKTLSPIMYEVFKAVVNEDYKDYYARFSNKATIFWGKNDTATPIQSYEKIRALMPEARGFVLEGDHYFFLDKAKLIDKIYNEN